MKEYVMDRRMLLDMECSSALGVDLPPLRISDILDAARVDSTVRHGRWYRRVVSAILK